MITISLHLDLPIKPSAKSSVITVYFKNRTNIIGTCSVEQHENNITGTFSVADELTDNLYVLYIYASASNEVILDGILLDDSPHNKSISTVGSSKIN